MNTKLLKKGKRLLLLWILFITVFPVFSQGYLDPNTLLLYGQVLNRNNGAPVAEQTVFLESKSDYNPNFIYSDKLVTDEKGFFSDTILTFQHKGGIDIFTFNEQNIICDTLVYFRFNWDENSSIVVNLYVDDSVSSNNFQANFSSLADTANSNMMKYFFTDNTITTGYDSISWHWNFGDNHFSSEQSPVHQYASVGVYKVTMTVTANCFPSGEILQSSLTKIVKATLNEYFSFGGHVFSDYFPIDLGIAYLYKLDEKELLPIDTFYFDTLGYYYFYQLIEGKYTVKSDLDPSSSLYNLFMQTYYGDAMFWNHADTVFLFNSNNWECDINLIPVNENNTGSGKVGGTIVYSEGGNSGKGGPACGIQIYLLDNNNIPLYCTHSDENGSFTFLDILEGSYTVFAEVIGKNTIPLTVEVTANNMIINTIQLFIGSEDISGNILNIEQYTNTNFSVRVYNDFTQGSPSFEITTQKAGLFSIHIFDLTGKPVFEDQQFVMHKYFSGSTGIDLARGVYLLNIKNESGQVTVKLIY